MVIDLVILDCDGVLVDSERIGIHVEARLLTELGWEMGPDEIVERFLGRPDSYMREQLEAHLGRSVPDFQDRYDEALFDAFRRDLEPVPGVIDALDRIDRPICVASSGTHSKMELTLGLTGLRSRFEGRIFSATDVARGKPAPDLFLHAAWRLGVDPSNCIVVEDSPAGLDAAAAAGMRAIAYAGGIVEVGCLRRPGVDIIDDMADLPARIEAAETG